MSHSSPMAARTMFGRVLSRFQQHLGAFALALALAFVGARSVTAHEFKVGDLEIEHPWSRATPAGAKVAGGYFTIVNKGNAPDRLMSISSDVSDKAELHQMGVQNGVMTMRPVEGGLDIPAGGKVTLAPGGYHLMFIGLKRQPKQGEKFAATLTFEKAGTVTVEFAVEGMGETGDMDMDHAD